MKLNFWFLLVYVVILSVLPFIEQLHLPTKFFAWIPAFGFVTTITSWLYRNLSYYYWPLTFLYAFCSSIYLIFYPVCLLFLETGKCLPPDTIRYNYLIDQLFFLVVLIVRLLTRETGRFAERNGQKWTTGAWNIFTIIFSGPLGYFSSTNTISPPIAPLRTTMTTTTINTPTTTATTATTTTTTVITASSTMSVRREIFWISCAVISTLALVLNYALRDHRGFDEQTKTGFIPYDLADTSFGYLPVTLINIAAVLLAANFSWSIDQLPTASRLEKMRNHCCKFFLACILGLDVTTGICLAIFFEIF